MTTRRLAAAVAAVALMTGFATAANAPASATATAASAAAAPRTAVRAAPHPAAPAAKAVPAAAPTAAPHAVVCSATAALGSTSSCDLPAGGGTAEYTFALERADTVRFRAAVTQAVPSRTMTITDESGAVVCTAVDVGPHSCRLPAGTYVLAVAVAAAVTVHTSIDGVTAATCRPALDLTVGAPSVPVVVDKPGASWCAAVTAAAGDVLEFGLDTTADQVLDLAAYDANGRLVCDVPFSSQYGRVYCTVAGGDAVRLFATPESDRTQSARLMVARVSHPSGCVVRALDAWGAAPAHRGALPAHGERCYSIPAGAKFLGIHLLGVGEIPRFALRWTVRGADGAAVCAGTSDNGGFESDPLDSCRILKRGGYALFVTSQATTAISYAAGVFDLGASDGCVPLADAGWSAAGATTDLAAPAQANCVAVTPGADPRPTLRLVLDDAGKYDVRASVVTAEGKALCYVDRPEDCALPGPGDYRVLVYNSTTASPQVTYWITDTTDVSGCAATQPDSFGSAPTRSGVIGAGIRARCWTFTAPAGAAYFLDGGSTDNNSLYLTWELRGSGGYRCAPSIGSCVVPAAGTYLLVAQYGGIALGENETGTVTAGLWRLDRVASCPRAGTSFAAAPIEGELTVPLQVDCHQFAAVAGDRIFLHAVPFNYNPFHQVFDATGASVCFAFESACTLSGTGPFRIVTYAQLNSTDPTPAYRLRVVSLTSGAGCAALPTTPFGTGPTRVVDESDPIDMRCFAVTQPAGGRLDFSLVDDGEGFSNTRFDVYGPDGTRACLLGEFGGDCPTPTAGRYLAVIYSQQPFTGRIAAYDLHSADGCVAGPSLAFGAAATSVDVAAAGALTCLTVPFAAGDRGRLNFAPDDSDSSWVATLVDDAGQQVCAVETSFLEPVGCKVPSTLTGPARIVVRGYGAGAGVGTYALHAWRLNDPAGCVDLGSLAGGFGPLKGRLADSSDEACYRAQGKPGTLSITTANDTAPRLVPAAEFLTRYGLTRCVVVGTGACTLATSGTYTIVVRKAYLAPPFRGRYDVAGECASTRCGP